MQISDSIVLPMSEVTITAIRSQGAGGQHVNKVATAVQLRFHVPSSSLPEELKMRLLNRADRRISKDGTLIIKAQEYKSQKKNRDTALEILKKIIRQANYRAPRRIPTKPSWSARQARVDEKKKLSRKKALRKKIKKQDIDE
ncbi:MAG: alternative ribosome rescue aminoacyl-tRNA hydrolase ArfB [Fidelibacterota bacterium]